MSELKFEMTLPANHQKLFQMAIDYENMQKFFTQQIKSIKIINVEDKRTTTEEMLSFSSIIKAKITQQTIHEIREPGIINSKVISGPFSGSTLNVVFDKFDDGTKIMVKADLNISLKYKILLPIIKKYYKTILAGLFYKMNTLVMKS